MPRAGYEWSKRFLIPFWVIESFWTIIEIGLTAFLLAVVEDDGNEIDSDLQQDGHGNFVGHYKKPLVAVSAVTMVFYAAVLLLTIAEMILYCARRLKPILFLVSNVLKSVFWLVVLILDIVGAVKGHLAAGSVFLTVIIFLCFLGPLIYSAVSYHRFRRSGPPAVGVGQTYTSLGREGPQAGSNGASQLNPFSDPSYETRSHYSGTPSHNASATEMGILPDIASSTRYGESGASAAAVGAVGRPEDRTELHGGTAIEYYQPYAPDSVGGYESYRAPAAAPSSQIYQ
ncbi:MAG: hypothetical protein M1821_002365 [Bathelium mastoideum]|nr:MAG: hypothetical protein M1821_002365 [Bathelium mastoideum]